GESSTAEVGAPGRTRFHDPTMTVGSDVFREPDPNTFATTVCAMAVDSRDHCLSVSAVFIFPPRWPHYTAATTRPSKCPPRRNVVSSEVTERREIPLPTARRANRPADLRASALGGRRRARLIALPRTNDRLDRRRRCSKCPFDRRLTKTLRLSEPLRQCRIGLYIHVSDLLRGLHPSQRVPVPARTIDAVKCCLGECHGNEAECLRRWSDATAIASFARSSAPSVVSATR